MLWSSQNKKGFLFCKRSADAARAFDRDKLILSFAWISACVASFRVDARILRFVPHRTLFAETG